MVFHPQQDWSLVVLAMVHAVTDVLCPLTPAPYPLGSPGHPFTCTLIHPHSETAWVYPEGMELGQDSRALGSTFPPLASPRVQSGQCPRSLSLYREDSPCSWVSFLLQDPLCQYLPASLGTPTCAEKGRPLWSACLPPHPHSVRSRFLKSPGFFLFCFCTGD